VISLELRKHSYILVLSETPDVTSRKAARHAFFAVFKSPLFLLKSHTLCRNSFHSEIVIYFTKKQQDIHDIDMTYLIGYRRQPIKRLLWTPLLLPLSLSLSCKLVLHLIYIGEKSSFGDRFEKLQVSTWGCTTSVNVIISANICYNVCVCHCIWMAFYTFVTACLQL